MLDSATATKHQELLLEQEVLGDHGSDPAGATQRRARDGKVD